MKQLIAILICQALVGIYKTHNATKSVTVNPHAFALRDANGQRQATTGISV